MPFTALERQQISHGSKLCQLISGRLIGCQYSNNHQCRRSAVHGAGQRKPRNGRCQGVTPHYDKPQQSISVTALQMIHEAVRASGALPGRAYIVTMHPNLKGCTLLVLLSLLLFRNYG